MKKVIATILGVCALTVSAPFLVLLAIIGYDTWSDVLEAYNNSILK